jgi:O-acetylserine/cysteine efflux transporter
MSPRNILLALLVPVIWGFNFVVADDAVQHIPAFLLVALRYLVVAALFLPFTRRNISWRNLALIGLLYGVVQFSGLFLGLEKGVDSGLAGTLIQSQALVTVVLARFVLHEAFGALQWAGLGLGVAGLATIAASGGGNAPLAGVLWILFGALGWGLSNIALKKVGPLPAWNLTVWQSVTVVPAMLVLSGLFDHGQVHAVSHITATAVLAILYIAVLATGLGNFLWYRLIQQVGPAKTAPFSLLVPVVSLLSGWLVRGEGLSGVQAVGVVLILVGVAAIALSGQLTGMWNRRRAVTEPRPAPVQASPAP